MRVAVLSAMLIASTLGGAEAASVRWQGQLLITGKSGTCPDYDPTGEFATARFRPADIGSNGPGTSFSIYTAGRPSSMGFRLLVGSFTATFKLVATMGMGDGFGPFVHPAYVRFTKISPAIAATAQNLTINGEIKGFDDMPNCVAIFTMGLIKRPD